MTHFRRCVVAVLCTLAIGTQMASAHDFIVKPEAGVAQAGETLPVSLIVTEVYLKPGRMPPETSTLSLLTANDVQEVSLAADEANDLLEASVDVPDDGTFLLHGYATRSRENRMPEGATGDPGMLKMEWFSKAIVNPAEGDEIYKKALGDRVEIVPLVNPSELRPGNTMAVKVLADGEPVSARIGATYDGHSDEEHDYIVRTQSGEDGIAYFTVTEPGLWFVRSKVSFDEKAATHTKYEGAANLVFAVAAPK